MIYSNEDIEKTRNSKKVDRRIYKSRRIEDFRDLAFYSCEHYSNNIAYKYRLNPTDDEIIEKTYADAYHDMKAFGTAMLNRNLKTRKVAVIGEKRYEWCMTYLGVTTTGLIIVPLDKLLPEREIENLIKRSNVECIVCDKKYIEILKKIKTSGQTNLNTIICMDEPDDNEVEYWEFVKQEGEKAIDSGDTKYDNVEIDEKAMSILLFTSGTTSEAKGVMLSQKNFCDGLKHYAQNLKDYNVTIIVAVPALLEAIY